MTRLTPEVQEELRRYRLRRLAARRRVTDLRGIANAIRRGEALPEGVRVRAWDLYKAAYDFLEGENDDIRELRLQPLARAYLRLIDHGENRRTLEGWENWETLAREFVTTVNLVEGEHQIAKSLRHRNHRAAGARRSAKKARENRASQPRKPTRYEKLLGVYEETVLKARLTRASPLKSRKGAADWLHCRLSYVNKLLKRGDEERR